MALHSRSDLVAVTVPAEGFGGCGITHRRPVVNGAPAKVWTLDCPPCENHLRHDQHWSTTLSELPETYDEKLTREDFEKRGALDERKLMAMALAKLTGIAIPDTIAGAISGRMPHIPGQLECAACGSASPPGQKFCGECGSPMSGPAPQASIPGPQPPAERPSPVRAGGKPRRLQDGRLDELQALARARGLSDQGTRKVLFTRLRAAGATDKDLRSLAVAA